MADYSGQLPGSVNGLESGSAVGSGQQTHSASLDLPQQGLPGSAPFGAPGLAYPSQYLPPQLAAQQEQLRHFWAGQMQEIHQVGTDPAEFKNHQLPLARIKKIMKSDEDVRMISAEAPVLFARACEMFILELTLRSWNHSEENKRRTLQRNDIAAAITRTDIFDFLVDIVPREERGEEQVTTPRAPSGGPGPAPSAGLQPYWQQQQQPAAAQLPTSAPGGGEHGGVRPPAVQMDPALMHFYLQQQQHHHQQQQHQLSSAQLQLNAAQHPQLSPQHQLSPAPQQAQAAQLYPAPGGQSHADTHPELRSAEQEAS